nr:hypothetical protein [uncultured Flavobacterium sp.]
MANLLTNVANSNDENLEYIELIKASAKDLDNITKELGSFIYELNHKKQNRFQIRNSYNTLTMT